MKEIKLTRSRITIVDDEEFEKLNQFKWRAHGHSNNCYAVRTFRFNKNEKQIDIIMHREILNAKKGISVDHVNGDRLDNRKENLRLATCAENRYNQKHANSNNKLGIKGVSYTKEGKKFWARIKINNKFIYLGSFGVMGDADSAYRKAEEKYFGKFARKC